VRSAAEIVTRLWRRDASLWSGDPEEQAAITARLGWLDAIEVTRAQRTDIDRCVAVLRDDGVQHAVLIGMGGSSLAPDVYARCVPGNGSIRSLRVLDSTHPDAIHTATTSMDWDRTVFIVSSKSGTTVETDALRAYCYEQVRRTQDDDAGKRFVAVTDPGSPLADMARQHGYRQVFLNAPDIGGRYSALSLFGMVPAALLGIDIGLIMARTETAMTRCRSSDDGNQALHLGMALAAHTRAGRDKLTLAVSPRLPGLGAWIEQLVAESSGKQGIGLVTIIDEPLLSPEHYGEDRVFVAVTNADEQEPDGFATLRAAGRPVYHRTLTDVNDIGAEFFHWMFTTAVLGACLGVNPFDEPDVNAAKQHARALLASPVEPPASATSTVQDWSLFAGGGLVDPADSAADGLARLVRAIQPGDYFAILAYLAPTTETEQQLGRLRDALRVHISAPVCVEIGPRYLHASGQLHKGGANNGVFLIVTDDAQTDITIPGTTHGFGDLVRAQAMGDYAALQERGRRVARAHLHETGAGLDAMIAAVENT